MGYGKYTGLTVDVKAVLMLLTSDYVRVVGMIAGLLSDYKQ